MFKWVPSPLKGLLNWLFLIAATLFWSVPMYVFFGLKVLIPNARWRRFCSDTLHQVGQNWTLSNRNIVTHTQKIEWDVDPLPELSEDKWYFIAANHQSWADIMVLTYLFAGKVPFIKYFVKDTLKYFPIIGIAWWAFEFPMMKRYSAKKLAKHPELRGKDIETTLKMCESYLRKPSTILNFTEGTRFTAKKHAKQKSPFKHLLKPKPGGVALTAKALGKHIDSLIHVTIIYPEGDRSFWRFMNGDMKKIRVMIEEVPIPEHFKTSDYSNDQSFRQEVRDWIYARWEKTDAAIEQYRLTQVSAPKSKTVHAAT